MKSVHEIKQRIQELERAKKNGVDTSTEINILESALKLSEKQIKTTLKNQVENNKYREARISLWLLEDSINNGW